MAKIPAKLVLKAARVAAPMVKEVIKKNPEVITGIGNAVKTGKE